MIVLRAKCIVLGDPTVGKSSLVQSFHSDGSSFPKSYYMTTGVELIQKFIHVGDSNTEMMDFFIFDSAGKELFSDICEGNWDKPGMFIIVFDVTNQKSFQNCAKWLKKIKSFVEPRMSVPGILIGNKTDLEKRRRVSHEEASEFAEKNSLKYFECSAKDHEGIEASFQCLGKQFFSLHDEASEKVQVLE